MTGGGEGGSPGGAAAGTALINFWGSKGAGAFLFHFSFSDAGDRLNSSVGCGHGPAAGGGLS